MAFSVCARMAEFVSVPNPLVIAAVLLVTNSSVPGATLPIPTRLLVVSTSTTLVDPSCLLIFRAAIPSASGAMIGVTSFTVAVTVPAAERLPLLSSVVVALGVATVVALAAATTALVVNPLRTVHVGQAIVPVVVIVPPVIGAVVAMLVTVPLPPPLPLAKTFTEVPLYPYTAMLPVPVPEEPETLTLV